MATEIDEAKVEDQGAEQLKAIGGVYTITAVGMFLSTFLTTIALWNVAPRVFLLLWAFSYWAVIVVRVVAFAYYTKRIGSAYIDSKMHKFVFKWTSTFNGINMGLLMWTVYPVVPREYGLIIVAVISAVISGAKSTTHLKAELGSFVMPCVVLAMPALIFCGDLISLIMAALMLLHIYVSSGFSRINNVEFKLQLERQIALNKEKQEAEISNQAKSEFIASASHDLRQPLQALGFYLRILRDRFSGDNMMLKKAMASFDALESLLKSLLDMSKLDSNTVQVDRRNVSVRSLFERLQHANEYAAGLKGLRLRFFSPSDAYLYTDPSQLERILGNLIENAIHYTAKGAVLVCCRRRQNHCLLQVWDTGPGIPEGEHEKIFNDYYQLNGSKTESHQGLGLGLAIVKRLTSLLECDLHLSSVEGKGTVFSLRVPLGDVDTETESLSRNVVMFKKHFTDKVVLVVDNDADIRESLSLLLDSWGGIALSVADKAEALELIEREQIEPDLIIADYRLSEDETGVDVVEALQSRFAQPVPVIIVTGETQMGSIKDIEATGLKWLPKPLHPDQLMSILVAVLTMQDKSAGWV